MECAEGYHELDDHGRCKNCTALDEGAPAAEDLPDVDAETIIRFAKIDLQIEDELRDLFNDLEEYDLADIDRTLVTLHARAIYFKGWNDGRLGVRPLTDA